MPPLKSDVWTWDTLIHIAIIIAVAIIARWLLRKGVDWTIHLMVSRSEKREARCQAARVVSSQRRPARASIDKISAPQPLAGFFRMSV
ncbi:potassium efflux system KefA protein [Cutibacterium acnes JCM 18916]|nr:potassium efflux system KefA protein [Cutibacterium acnes JCM 18916]